jgi:hypothetical protein
LNRLSAENLLHRRRFVLGSRIVPDFAHWPSVSIGGNLIVQAHTDLTLQQIQHGALRITLLGFVIDPDVPESQDRKILVDLASRCLSAFDAPDLAGNFSGRWVMIVDDGQNIILFSDPCGLREVFYTNPKSEAFWCASQPGLIAEVASVSIGQGAAIFMESDYFQNHHEPWWPGDTTQYDEISQLQPNHFLNLRTREMRRFWPNDPLEALDIEEAAQSVAKILSQSLRAAHNRFPLALPLTSGMDSRCILSASRKIDDVWHYTALHKGLSTSSPDIRVPGRLLRRLGRAHNVIACPESMSDEFAKIYRQNTSPAHDGAGAIAEGLFEIYPQERVSLSGHCSEIGRDTYGITHQPAPDAARLSEVARMHKNEFAIEHFANWIHRNQETVEKFGYRLWDIFFWEQEYGTWAANGQSQWDLIHERFTPFNNRKILNKLLGVRPELRQAPDYAVFRRIIEILWPELLAAPFNPPEHVPLASIIARARRVAKRLMRYS